MNLNHNDATLTHGQESKSSPHTELQISSFTVDDKLTTDAVESSK